MNKIPRVHVVLFCNLIGSPLEERAWGEARCGVWHVPCYISMQLSITYKYNTALNVAFKEQLAIYYRGKSWEARASAYVALMHPKFVKFEVYKKLLASFQLLRLPWDMPVIQLHAQVFSYCGQEFSN